jgi:hypothetical protein
MSYPRLYFRGMLQRIACISWESLQSLSATEIKEITNKTNRFLPLRRPKTPEKAQSRGICALEREVMHKSL